MAGAASPRWCFFEYHSSSDIVLMPRDVASPAELALALAPHVAAERLAWSHVDHRMLPAVVAHLASRAGGGRVAPYRLKHVVVRALREGVLVAVVQPRVPLFAARAAEPEPDLASLVGGAPFDDEPPAPLLALELDHRYHDDEPVHGAPFEVILADGRTVKGSLDAGGRARIEGVPAGGAQVRFEPDVRPWERIDKEQNPTFKETLTDADIDALFARHGIGA